MANQSKKEAVDQITATVPNTAKMLDVSERMVWGLIADNKLRSALVGNRRLVFIESVHRLLADGQREAA